jgi:hypothetical protein
MLATYGDASGVAHDSYVQGLRVFMTSAWCHVHLK